MVSVGNGVTLTTAGVTLGGATLPTVAVAPAATQADVPAVAGAAAPTAEHGNAGRFAETLFSCPQAATALAEGPCAWVLTGVTASTFDDGAARAFDSTVFSFAAGAQVEIAEDFFLGGALGVDSATSSSSTAKADGVSERAGFSFKYAPGNLSAGLAMTGAVGTIDTQRNTPTGLAEGDYGTSSVTARAEVKYMQSFGDLYAVPGVGASVTHLRDEAFTESGAGLNNASFDARNETVFGLHGFVDLGATLAAGPYDTLLRPRLRLGVDWLDDPSITSTGTVGTIAFANTLRVDRLTGRAGLGLEVFAQDDLVLDLGYEAQFGARLRSHGGQAKLSLNF